MVIHLLISFIQRGGGDRRHGTIWDYVPNVEGMSQFYIFARVGKALTNVPNFKFVPKFLFFSAFAVTTMKIGLARVGDFSSCMASSKQNFGGKGNIKRIDWGWQGKMA